MFAQLAWYDISLLQLITYLDLNIWIPSLQIQTPFDNLVQVCVYKRPSDTAFRLATMGTTAEVCTLVFLDLTPSRYHSEQGFKDLDIILGHSI